jgi:NlpC/P60 family/Bacterial dipeptidyl-peptidase Sh3 domain
VNAPVDPLTSGRAQVIEPVVDLMCEPGGPRDRQVLFGESVEIQGTADGWSRIKADKDGYAGYVRSPSLGVEHAPTHWISAPSSHIYSAPDLKSPDLMALSFGSRVTMVSQAGKYVETHAGFIPRSHLIPIGTHMSNPFEVAALFLGTPYLWGGNSRFGIDCSGLVQAAFIACGRPCPGDSHQQETAFGAALPSGTTPRRGDLLFWKGHVAMVVDADTLLHANAFHMAVSYEPLQGAIERIKAQDEGPVTSHIRP